MAGLCTEALGVMEPSPGTRSQPCCEMARKAGQGMRRLVRLSCGEVCVAGKGVHLERVLGQVQGRAAGPWAQALVLQVGTGGSVSVLGAGERIMGACWS